jgi:uncharacterized DUF497 family protein
MANFEWDPEKAKANLAKHRIAFTDAIRVFEDDHFVYRSDRAREERHVTVGSVDGRVIAVVWTPRGLETRRIISARRARHGEEEQYRKSTGRGH